MYEHGHSSVGIDPQKVLLQVLLLKEIDMVLSPRKILLLKTKPHFLAMMRERIVEEVKTS